MSDERLDLEDEVARLVRAGYGPATRPGLHLSEQAFRRLLVECRAQHSTVAFPDGVVGLLASILVLMAAWLAAQAVGGGAGAMTALPLLGAGLLALNLALVPAASIVIVMRRRYG